jgi:hypothetical protein
MKNKKVILVLFIIVSLAQLFVPVKMVLDNEDVLNNGIRYQLKIAHLNPEKAIYGDFIRLEFDYNSILVDKDVWQQSEAAYIQLTVREDSFAEISSIQKQSPPQTQDYVYVKIYDIEKLDSADKLIIEYPSINYFIEEIGSKERKKRIITQFFNDTSDAKAVVFVKEGQLILKEILIDDIPLKEKILRLEE